MKDDAISSISNILAKYMDGVDSEMVENAVSIRNVWKDIICSIRGPKKSGFEENIYLGEKLYSHTKIIDLVNKVLLVEVDHSGWIQTLQFYNSYILRGLKKKIPALEITSIAFRLKGSDFGIKNISEAVKKEEEKEEIQKEIQIKEDLPEDLKEKLEKLKNISKKNKRA